MHLFNMESLDQLQTGNTHTKIGIESVCLLRRRLSGNGGAPPGAGAAFHLPRRSQKRAVDSFWAGCAAMSRLQSCKCRLFTCGTNLRPLLRVAEALYALAGGCA
jgi:hypothetical protein